MVNDRAHEVAERLAELSRQRERGLITEWEYHEASSVILEGRDAGYPAPEAGAALPLGRAYVRPAQRRLRVRWLRVGILVVVLAGVAAAVWLLVVQGDDAEGSPAATTTPTTTARGPAESTVPATTVPSGGGEPTTTTTLPSQLASIAEAVRGHRSAAETLRAEAEAANVLWEERTADYAATHDEFARIAEEARSLAAAAAEVSPPTGFVRDYRLTVTVLDELAEAAAGLVSGLEASDDGTRRRAALEALVTADLAHDAAVTALLTMLGIEDVPQPAL